MREFESNTVPKQNSYVAMRKARFWCQKVLPLVYDDSLSYYELLSKILDYINKILENLELIEEDIANILENWAEFETYVNESLNYLENEINEKYEELKARIIALEEKVEAYKAELDAKIAAEEAARILADEQLQENIDNEATARQSADEQLQENIDAKQNILTAGDNITIVDDVISAVDTTYTAGENISISDDNVISATCEGETYTAGENITISDDNVISATDTTYTAGENITISDDNVISATGGSGGETYTAGENITISADNVISAVDTTYVEGFGIDIGSVDSYFTRLQGAYPHTFETQYAFKLEADSTNTPLADSFSTDTPYAIDLLSMENGTRTFGCTTSNGDEFSITVTKSDDRYVTFSGVYGEHTVADCISMLDLNGSDIAVLVPIHYTNSNGWNIYEYGVYEKKTVYAIGTKYYLFGWGVRLELYDDSIPNNAISVESGILGEITNIATNVENLSVDLSGKQDTLVAGDNITISGNTISATDTTYTGDGTVVNISDENVISLNFANAVESSGLPVRSGTIMNEFMSFVEKATISFSYTDLSIPAGDSYIDMSKSVAFTVPDGYTVVSVIPQVNFIGDGSTLVASPLVPLWFYDGATSRWNCGLQNPSDIDPTAYGTISGSATVYLTLLMIKTSYI